jgi:hypothetical protein
MESNWLIQEYMNTTTNCTTNLLYLAGNEAQHRASHHPPSVVKGDNTKAGDKTHGKATYPHHPGHDKKQDASKKKNGTREIWERSFVRDRKTAHNHAHYSSGIFLI